MQILQSIGKVGPGFCLELCGRQDGGVAADQTNAMLAVVLTDDTFLASPQAAKLVRSVVRPLPTDPASLGFGGNPM